MTVGEAWDGMGMLFTEVQTQPNPATFLLLYNLVKISPPFRLGIAFKTLFVLY